MCSSVSGGAGGAFCEAAGDVFTPTLALVTGQPVCFECERHPAAFLITTSHPTALGGVVSQSFRICKHDVGPVAADLPRDVDVVITRLRKDPS